MPRIQLKEVQYLVFQGGSVKGLAYVGAYQQLLEAGLLAQKLKAIAGTSAGAITAMGLSLGYSGEEILALMRGLNFKNFLDNDKVDLQSLVFGFKESQGKAGFFSTSVKNTSNSKLSKASAMLANTFGLFQGEVIRKWSEDLIKAKTKTVYLTFEELHVLHEKFPETYKDLYVIGNNVNTNLSEVFCWETTPNVIISDAVRISMSIPFIFKPHQVYIKQNEERVLDPKKAEMLYIDGGITDNFPLFVFDQMKYIPEHLKNENMNQDGRYANPATLGFRLVKKEERNFLMNVISDAPSTDITKFLDYTQAVLNSLSSMRKQKSDHLLSGDQWRTIYIDTCGVNTLDFDLTKKQQDSLLASGKKSVEEFFGEPELAFSTTLKL